MRRNRRRLLAATTALIAFAPFAWMQDGGVETLSRFVPSGAVVAIEARDLMSLLDTWNNAPEKEAWLNSDSYASFSRSKLFLRLKEAQTEFGAATSLPIDLAQMEAIAGGESVVALYDIGELRLLYITELSRSVGLETALLRSRLNLEPRQAAGIDYWVHTASESGRELAFTAVDNHLFVATSDTLLGRALELHAGQGNRALTSEAWYPTHGPRGDIRLIENLRTLVRSPHFRSYWIQGNITELSAYASGTADLFMEAAGIREHRRLVRIAPTDGIEESSVADLTSIVPIAAPFHRAWDRPTPEAIVELLSQKLLAPGDGGQAPRYSLAPSAPGRAARLGNNLETSIDTPSAAVSRSSLNQQPLNALVSETEIRGLLHIQRSTAGSGLIRFPSLVGILADGPWNEASALDSFQRSTQGLWTTSGLGVGWEVRGNHYALAGLRDLFIAVRNDLLLVSNSEELLTATLARHADLESVEDQAIFRARFRHESEIEHYTKVISHLDFLEGRNPLQTPRQPTLFADTIGSLGGVLSRVDAVEVERFDRGAYTEETVLYRMPQ